jgi:general secretion pathway protein E
MTALNALLTDSGVDPADLDKARAYQQKYGGRIEQILVNMGSLSADALPGIFSRLLDAPVLAPRYAMAWEPPEGVDELPLDFLLERGWLPVERPDGRWVFATHAPLDLEVNEWLSSGPIACELRLTSEEQFDVLKARLGRRKEATPGPSLSTVEEGRLREAQYKNGRYHDVVRMAVLRREWSHAGAGPG